MATDKDGKEINKPLAKPLATAAGVLGLIQGIAWTVFSILCICCYYGSIQLDAANVSPNQTEYYQLIYEIFLDGSTRNVDVTQNTIIKPTEFSIFMWFYIVFSAFWATISGAIVWAMIHDQWHLTKSLFGGWSGVTVLVSIVDIVLTGLLINDYIAVTAATTSTEVIVCYGIVMSLAARGYLLLIFNIVFAAIMTKFTVELVMQKNEEPTIPIIHGYESSYGNPPWFDNSNKNFWESSPQYTIPRTETSHDNRGFERSQSFVSPPISNQNNYTPVVDNLYTPNSNSTYPSPANFHNAGPNNIYNGTPNNYGAPQNYSSPNNNPTSFAEAIANRTATIGRNKGRRSPPNHVRPPVIPVPDYTPPGSPNALKSVLRSKSNYNRSPY